MSNKNKTPKKTLFINKKVRIIDGVKINTVETEIASQYNALSVEVGTTGKNFNKNSKNSRLYLKIADSLNSDISIIKDASGTGFILRAKGDCEISTLIEALDFCSAQLKAQCENQERLNTEEPEPTLKQINLIKYLISQENRYILKRLPDTNRAARDVIDFLKNPKENIPQNCVKYIDRK